MPINPPPGWKVVLSPVESETLQLEFPSVRTLWVVLAARPLSSRDVRKWYLGLI